MMCSTAAVLFNNLFYKVKILHWLYRFKSQNFDSFFNFRIYDAQQHNQTVTTDEYVSAIRVKFLYTLIFKAKTKLHSSAFQVLKSCKISHVLNKTITTSTPLKNHGDR